MLLARYARCAAIIYNSRINNQSGAFPPLEMFWFADQNKQLSNQSVNLESGEVRPIKLLIVCRHYLTVDQVITDQY